MKFLTKIITLAPSAARGAGLNLPHGAAPTSPVDGDIWTTINDLWVRLSGVTRRFLHTGDGAAIQLLAHPTGTILLWAGYDDLYVPDGWLLCNGTLVSKTTYAALFAVTGHAYNNWVDPGSNQFRLPDLRGRAPIGAGQGSGLTNRILGSSGGAETHTLTTGQMPKHSHSFTQYGIGWGAGSTGSSFGRADGNSPSAFWTGYTLGNAGNNEAHPNMQPYLTVNFIIKT